MLETHTTRLHARGALRFSVWSLVLVSLFSYHCPWKETKPGGVWVLLQIKIRLIVNGSAFVNMVTSDTGSLRTNMLWPSYLLHVKLCEFMISGVMINECDPNGAVILENAAAKSTHIRQQLVNMLVTHCVAKQISHTTRTAAQHKPLRQCFGVTGFGNRKE